MDLGKLRQSAPPPYVSLSPVPPRSREKSSCSRERGNKWAVNNAVVARTLPCSFRLASVPGWNDDQANWTACFENWA